MTSVQTMLSRPAALLIGACLGFVLSALALTGCSSPSALTVPQVTVAPYDTANGQVLWAVAPVRNESGTTAADTGAVADAVIAAAQQVRGIRCLPLNRSIEAMRVLGLLESGITTPTQAEMLMNTLGVDGILAGSITAYDPYNPPVLGLSLALFSRDRALPATFNPFDLSRSFTDHENPDASNFNADPMTVVSGHYDARNHETLLQLKRYAEGRSDPDSALNWHLYRASMGLYTQFVAHQAVRELLDDEWIRLAKKSRVVHADD